MGWFGSDSPQSDSYDQYTQAAGGPNKPTISHELIAGAAAFEAAKAYENHVAENGQPASHAEAKELLAGFTGAFVDREVETRGLDYIDSERAKRDATDQVHGAYDDNCNNNNNNGGYDDNYNNNNNNDNY